MKPKVKTPKPKFKSVTLPTITGLSPTESGAPEGGFILSVRGTDSSGKSDFAARACPSKPKGYYFIDPGADRIIRKYKAKGFPILTGNFNYEKPPTFVEPADKKDKQSRAWWKQKGGDVRDNVMEPFLESWREAYADPDIRTMVQDTATEFYEMMQLAHFGKVQQNEQREYGALYADFLGPIKQAKMEGKLVVLLHQMKDEYANQMQGDGSMKSERTGKLKRAGCGKINFVFDGEIETRHTNEVRKKRGGQMVVETPEAWEVEIVNCKHDPSMNGTVLDNPSFDEVMAIMAPGVDPSFWE